MMLHRMGWLFRKVLYPSLTWRIEASTPSVFLTFDDGPIPEVTPRVLELLEQYGAKATFFCVGDNVRKHQGLFQEVMAAGHGIGNHTFHHLNGWKTNPQKYMENVAQAQRCLEEAGAKTKGKPLFRPPYGRISRKQIQLLKAHYRIVMWEVLSGDFLPKLRPETCLKKTLQYTKPGSIIVFHDNIKAREKVEYTLPQFLEYCEAKGWECALLPGTASAQA